MKTTLSVKGTYVLIVVAVFSWIGLAHAEEGKDVNIVEGVRSVTFSLAGKSYTIERIQDQNNAITGGFAKTSRPCPPFCLHPILAAPGVMTVGELEVIEFIKNKVANNSGILVDARAPSFYEKGTIPGSINVPFTVFAKRTSDPDFVRAMLKFGVKKGTTVNYSNMYHRGTDAVGEPLHEYAWDFSEARELLLFCNGPWCDQSPRAIKGLIQAGYPTNKLFYYRNGMNVWLLHGLNVVVPTDVQASK
jgi:rhodanese-related sulfurtransferase